MKQLSNIELMKIRRSVEMEEATKKTSKAELYAQRCLGTENMQRIVQGVPDGRGNFLCTGRPSGMIVSGPFHASLILPVLPMSCNDPDYATRPILNQPVTSSMTIPLEQTVQVRFPLIRLIRSLQGFGRDRDNFSFEDDLEFGQYLYRQLKLEDIHPMIENNWSRSYTDYANRHDCCDGEELMYYDPSGIFEYRAELVNWNNHALFLPIAYFQYANHAPLRLYMDNRRPLWFYRKLGISAIQATAVMTDEIGLIMANSDTEKLQWFGLFGKDDIDHVEIEHFRNRERIWVILADEDKNIHFQKALRVMERFEKMGMSIKVAVFDHIHWSCADNLQQTVSDADFQLLDKADFIFAAHQCGCRIPKLLQHDRYGEVDFRYFPQAKRSLLPDICTGGDLILFEELDGTPPHLAFRFLQNSVENHVSIFGTQHPAPELVKQLLFITPGEESFYLKNTSLGTWCRLHTFSQSHQFSPLECLKLVIEKFDPDIVLFDTESVFDTTAQTTLKEMLAYCRTRRIGIAMIFNANRSSGPLPTWLRSLADHRVQIHPIPQQSEYAVESYNGETKIQVKWSYSATGLAVSGISSGELRKISNREVTISESF